MSSPFVVILDSDFEDHETRMLDRLIQWFRKGDNWETLMEVLSEWGRTQEDWISYMDGQHDIDSCEGEHLSRRAVLIGVTAGGMTDGELRRLIRAKRLANISSKAAVVDLSSWNIMARILDEGIDNVSSSVQPMHPAAILGQYIVDAPLDTEYQTEIHRYWVQALPAGVGYNLVEGVAPAFRFDIGFGFDEGLLGDAVGP
jgi:hypothetical protein